MSTTTLEKPTMTLLSLFCSVNFDKKCILIADESGIEDGALVLYLEDKNDRKSELDELVRVSIPLDQFAKIITDAQLNSYEGTLYSESNRPYKGRVVINAPLDWYEQDATTYERQGALEVVLNTLLTH